MILKLSIAAMAMVASVYAGNLTFESGTIKVHTEMFGDSTIDPMSNKAISHLTMEDVPATLHGSIEVEIKDFISDNTYRDEHMYEALESPAFPKAIFEIKEVVVKEDKSYILKGIMNLHGVSKSMDFKGTIHQEENTVTIKAAGILNMSDFGIKPITLVVLSVRDQVDVSVDLLLKR